MLTLPSRATSGCPLCPMYVNELGTAISTQAPWTVPTTWRKGISGVIGNRTRGKAAVMSGPHLQVPLQCLRAGTRER